MVTVWSRRAWTELQNAYQFIELESLQNAEKVRDDLFDIADDLPNHPEKYPPDKFKKDNNGTWRAFEKHHYRVSYLITEKNIRIVRIRHTKQSPLMY